MITLTATDCENIFSATTSNILYLLDSFFYSDTAKIMTWMAAKNPLLGEVKPIDMILLGRQIKLQEFIARSLVEQRLNSLSRVIMEVNEWEIANLQPEMLAMLEKKIELSKQNPNKKFKEH